MSDESISFVGRYEWERIVRRCLLPMPVKAAAAYVAQYANKDGTSIYPGVARLAVVSGMSERSARGALTVLREDLQLLTRIRKGSSLGRQALADEYRLSYPADLRGRVHMLDPEESPGSAACDPSCMHPLSPARPAGDNRAAAKEHRHLMTGTPARGAGSPAPHDRNTGTSCPPPTHDPHTYPLIDQRDDHLGNGSTEGDPLLLAKLIEIDRAAAARRGA